MQRVNSDQVSALIGQCLVARNWRIAVAESCTGGGLAHCLTAVAGASQWFDRGFVTYCAAAKIEMLGVSESTLQKYGEVSEETAAEMALGVLRHSLANISCSITGIAGPSGGSSEKPVGTVCFALARRVGGVQTYKKLFKGERHEVRDHSIDYALTELVTILKQ